MPATYVSVIGGSSCSAERGGVVVNGGMAGGMEAVARGVRRGGGTCVGVLPGLDRRGAAPDLTLSLLTGLGHARNLAVVASGDVVIALGGSWGTLSEIGLARSIGREVVLLESWSVAPHEGAPDGLHRAASVPEAVERALGLAQATSA